MAESQLLCLEDGLIGSKVPESSPEFYYSEPQRAALEELLRNGDGAFKTRLKDDDMTDFLSAREIKLLLNTFSKYDSAGDVSSGRPGSAGSPGSEQGASERDHSTYWPQMSDTEVPPLDMGWTGGGLFKGVTRVAVHTHPPKENGPHVKEVVRRLIQEASKLIAIVMDLLTDPQILRDLMDAASRRSVRVYILLENRGVPHFLDMCSRLKIDQQHLRNIRARSLQGVGLGLSFGKLPGSLCYKYMLVDGDKVMFGSYSFCWCTSRMDRNMITVMTGQVVDFFDGDFRELYAVSENLDLYKEFHVSRPAANLTGSELSKAAAAAAAAAPKRPLIRANTSRFQVSLGDPGKAGAVQVPAHKYYNPKYALAFGDVPRPPASLQVRGPKRGSVLGPTLEEEEGKNRVTTSERMDRLSPQPSDAPSETLNWSNGTTQEKKGWSTFVKKLSRMKSSRKLQVKSHTGGSPPLSPGTSQTDVNEENLDVFVRTPSKWKAKKLGRRTDSEQTVNTTQDNESVTSQHRGKPPCKVS